MRANPIANQTVNTEVASSGAAGKNEKIKKSRYDSAVENHSHGGKNESVRAEISSRAKDMSKIKQIAADSPDVREAKVAELREKIRSGKYDVGAGEIADRLVEDHLQMHGA